MDRKIENQPAVVLVLVLVVVVVIVVKNKRGYCNLQITLRMVE